MDGRGLALDAPLVPGRPVPGRLDGAPVTAELVAGPVPTALRRADGRHLVRVRQVLAADAGTVVVRDAVDGADLEQERVRAGGALPLESAVALVADVLDGLADLHAAGLVHGDLQPSDVRLDASLPLRPVVRVTGWGTRGPGDPADDVRAAGRLLALLLTGDPEASTGPAVPPGLLDGTAAEVRDRLRALALEHRPAEAPRRSRRVPLLAGAGLLLAAAVGSATAAAVRPADPAPAPSSTPGAAEPYAFPPLVRPDGLVLERTWVLEDGGAVLRGTTVVRNAGEVPRNAGVDEVVPKSVADDVDDLAFTPGPDAIVERDPVVRFNVLGLAPGAATTWTFVVTLPPGAGPLEQLAADAEQARLRYETERRRLLEQLRATPAPR